MVKNGGADYFDCVRLWCFHGWFVKSSLHSSVLGVFIRLYGKIYQARLWCVSAGQTNVNLSDGATITPKAPKYEGYFWHITCYL